MTNTWGWKSYPEFTVKCDRCAQVECICGDAAFEAWVEEELASQQGGHAESYSDIPCAPDGNGN